MSLGGNFPDNGKNFGGIPADRYLAANTIIGIDVPTEITGSMVDRWSLALDQAVDSANMHVYTVFQHLTPEVDLVTKDPAVSHHGKLAHVNAPLDDFDLLSYRRANLLLIQSDGGVREDGLMSSHRPESTKSGACVAEAQQHCRKLDLLVGLSREIHCSACSVIP